MIRRAILSVSDKTGITELAQALNARGIEILSTGGTAKHLTDAGVPVIAISSWSGAPEILGGRVKTLTPKVFGAILFDRDNKVSDNYGVNAMPTTFLVDRQGRLRWQHRAYKPGDEAKYIEQIRAMLREKS